MIETHSSFCRVCHAACPILVDIEDARTVVEVRGDLADPLFEGYTCVKGRQLPDQHHHPDRLRSSLERTEDGGFRKVPSHDALDSIARRIDEVVLRHGPRAVASYTGTGAFQNSTSVAVASAWHKGFDSPSFYTSITIDQPAHRAAALRMGSWEAGWQNFTDADVSLAVGYNPLVSSYAPSGGLQGTNPFVALRRARERGLSMIVVDPRRTELAVASDLWLQVQPGEDPSLLAGIIREIFRLGLVDEDFCRDHVEGLDALEAAVSPFTPNYVAERARVSAEDVCAAAELFGTGPRGSAGAGTGPNMAPHSMLTQHLVYSLNVICGRVNRPGDLLEGGSFLFPGDPRRAQVIAPSDPAPGTPHRLRGLSGMAEEMLTNTLADEILLPGEGQVRALIVSGGNPVVAWPDQAKTIAAMESLDLLVVIDHRMTATAEYADYVIAPRLELERADVPHIMDRWFPAPYTNYTPAVLETNDDLLAEWEVFAGIARRRGTPIVLPGGEIPANASPDGTGLGDDTVIDLVYGTARLPVDQIRASRGVVHETARIRVVEGDPESTAKFSMVPPGITGELVEVLGEETSAERLSGFDADRYPFRLVSRRSKHVLNSLGRELPGLARLGSTNHAYLHPDDLAELDVSSGKLVRITSPHGTIDGVAAAAEDVKRGVVSMSHSWGGSSVTDEEVRTEGSPTNRLISTDAGFDPITGMAIQSAIPVRVTALEEVSTQ